MGFDSAIIFPFCRAEYQSVYWEQPAMPEQLSPHGCGELAKGQEVPFANPQ